MSQWAKRRWFCGVVLWSLSAVGTAAEMHMLPWPNRALPALLAVTFMLGGLAFAAALSAKEPRP